METETGSLKEGNVKLRKQIKSLNNSLLFQSITLITLLSVSLVMAYLFSPLLLVVSVFLLYDLAETLGKYVYISREMRVLNTIKKILEDLPWAQLVGREGEVEQALKFINYRIENGQSSKDALDRFRKDIENITGRQ